MFCYNKYKEKKRTEKKNCGKKGYVIRKQYKTIMHSINAKIRRLK